MTNTHCATPSLFQHSQLIHGAYATTAFYKEQSYVSFLGSLLNHCVSTSQIFKQKQHKQTWADAFQVPVFPSHFDHPYSHSSTSPHSLHWSAWLCENELFITKS